VDNHVQHAKKYLANLNEGSDDKTVHELSLKKINVGRKSDIWEQFYLSLKKAFSVNPVQAVAIANTNVVNPKAEWTGTWNLKE